MDAERQERVIGALDEARRLLARAVCLMGFSDGKAFAQHAHGIATEAVSAVDRARTEALRGRMSSPDFYSSVSIQEGRGADRDTRWNWCVCLPGACLSGRAASFDDATTKAFAALLTCQETSAREGR